MTNKFDLNKFNSFLDSAAKTIACDSECQSKKTAHELKNQYLSSQTNLALAEPQYEIAKKNYYVYVSGKRGYNEMMESEYTEKAELIAEKFKEMYDEEITKIKDQLNTYNGLLINFRNVFDLHRQYKKENEIMAKKLKEDSNDILTNERKTFYEDQEIDSLNKYYYYILTTIYTIVVICFAVFSLLYPSQMSWKIKLFLLIVLIILPFISTLLLGKIVSISYWLFGLLPKNVYK